MQQQKNSPDTINRFLAALKSFYKTMIRLNYYSHENPLVDHHSENVQIATGFRNGRPRMPAVAGTEPPLRNSYRGQSDSYFKMYQNEWLPVILDDVSLPSQVYNAAKKAKLTLRDQVIIRMLFETGARASEVIEVTIGDFRARRSIREIATFNKGSNGRRTKFLLFSNDTYILLKKYLKNERIKHDPIGLHYDKLPSMRDTAERRDWREYHTGGVFLDVVPFERLVFTWGYPDDPIENSPVVTLTLTAQGDRTEMIFHLRGLTGQPGDKYYYDGWSNALDDLTRHLRDQKQ